MRTRGERRLTRRGQAARAGVSPSRMSAGSWPSVDVACARHSVSIVRRNARHHGAVMTKGRSWADVIALARRARGTRRHGPRFAAAPACAFRAGNVERGRRASRGRCEAASPGSRLRPASPDTSRWHPGPPGTNVDHRLRMANFRHLGYPGVLLWYRLGWRHCVALRVV